MRKWNDLPLGLKLAVGFGLTLLLMAGLSLRAVQGADDVGDDYAAAVRLEQLLYDLSRREAGHLEWALEVGRGLAVSSLAGVKAEPDPRACRFGRWYYGEERRELERLMPETVRPLAELEAPHAAFHRSYQAMRDLLASPGREAAARTVFLNETLPNLERFRGLLRQTEDLVRVRTEEVEREIEGRMARHRWFVRLYSLAAALCALGMAVVIGRGVSRPLRRAAMVADRIAVGDLAAVEADLDVTRQDEIGAFNRSFASMAASLRAVARSMERVAEGDLSGQVEPRSEADVMGRALAAMLIRLRELTAQIQAAVSTLSSAIGEISASSGQLSSNSAETAAAVSQTSTAVEEVKQTSRLSSQRAAAVAESAQRAASVAQAGTRSTAELREAMGLVSRKMDLAAQDIVRLSEKTRRIGEVIATVGDLADRSNILAVNASIEAAASGEEGRGFLVVADEIKALAAQSKQAAAQVRTLLQDIQKATGSAVMATEDGGKAVEAGSKLSARAEESIVKLADSVAEAARAAVQIAASSAEDLLGMDQAAQAMESVRQASAQNMDSARQLAASVRGLDDISRALSALVRRYKL